MLSWQTFDWYADIQNTMRKAEPAVAAGRRKRPMKEWGFEKFLEEFSIEDMMDDFAAEVQEEMVALLRKAYISGYDSGVRLTTERLKQENQS